MSLDLFLSAFVSIFVIADPFGTATVFATLTRNIDEAQQRKIAIKAVIISACILIAFSLAGQWLLDHTGISIAAFRTAGGFLLFITAFRMIMGFHDPDHLNSEKSAYRDRSDIAVFPMSIPLLAGPGCMTATLMFSTSSNNVIELAEVWVAIILVQSIALLCLFYAGRLSKFFGSTGSGIIARIMGILLAGMAVQFIADGMKVLLPILGTTTQ